MAKIALLNKGKRYYCRTKEQLMNFSALRPSYETKKIFDKSDW